jgi:hypothetical protein
MALPGIGSARLQLPEREISKYVFPTSYQAPKLAAHEIIPCSYLTLLKAHTAARCYLIVQLLVRAKTFDMEVDLRQQWWWTSF